jgi:hypothetical protein
MELIIALTIAVVAFLGLDIAAIAFGADSRPGMADDHAR